MCASHEDIVSTKCQHCGESFLDNSADQNMPDLFCSRECLDAATFGVCDEAQCQQCGIARLYAFESPNYCKCTCHPENFDRIPKVVDPDTASAFMAFVVLKRLTNNGVSDYQPTKPMADYTEKSWLDPEAPVDVPVFSPEQAAVMEEQHEQAKKFLGDDFDDLIQAFRWKLEKN